MTLTRIQKMTQSKQQKRRKKGLKFKPLDPGVNNVENNFNRQTINNTTSAKSSRKEVKPNKNKTTMPRELIKDLKGITQGEFSVKQTNYTLKVKKTMSEYSKI